MPLQPRQTVCRLLHARFLCLQAQQLSKRADLKAVQVKGPGLAAGAWCRG
jgi:hypothetical protein